MKISFDQKSVEYKYPVSKKDIDIFKTHVSNDVLNKIRRIRIGCNTKTTQEGRMVYRGLRYDIRINFCLNRGKSPILTEDKQYIEQVKRYGGEIDFDSRTIKWSSENAKYYAYFILAHEVAHIVYSEKHNVKDIGYRESNKEEKWCDNYAEAIITEIKNGKPPNKSL